MGRSTYHRIAHIVLAIAPVLVQIHTSTAEAQTTVYVDGGCGNDAWSGHEPACAAMDGPKATIQGGIIAATAEDIVQVAPGSYHESIDYMGKAITLRSSEGPSNTIIDGSGFNNTVVAIISGEGPGTVLEGFTITGGTGFEGFGGGVVIFDSQPVIRNNIISGNPAIMNGGGVYIIDPAGTVTISSCVLSNNSANTPAQGHGGAIYIDASPGAGDVVIQGCTITANSATDRAGGISVVGSGSDVLISQTILWGNTAPNGPAELNLFGATAEVVYSDIAGGLDGVGVVSGATLIDGGHNLDVNPLFIDPDGGDHHVRACAPVQDAGDPAYVPGEGETDIDGEPRIMEAIVDIGADEVNLATAEDCNDNGVADGCEVPQPDLNGDLVVNAADLALLLGGWGNCTCCPADMNHNDTVDAADLAVLLGAWGPVE